MKMNQAKQVVRKTKCIQQYNNEFNKLNKNIHNDLKHFLNEHERMTLNYNKMEQSSMQ
jgi:hypothetical protein